MSHPEEMAIAFGCGRVGIALRETGGAERHAGAHAGARRRRLRREQLKRRANPVLFGSVVLLLGHYLDTNITRFRLF